MTLEARAENGETLLVVAFDGNSATVHSPRAYVPGQPMKLTVSMDPPCSAEGRTTGSRRLPDGPFEIRIRLVSLTREDRERWLAAMSVSRRD